MAPSVADLDALDAPPKPAAGVGVSVADLDALDAAGSLPASSANAAPASYTAAARFTPATPGMVDAPADLGTRPVVTGTPTLDSVTAPAIPSVSAVPTVETDSQARRALLGRSVTAPAGSLPERVARDVVTGARGGAIGTTARAAVKGAGGAPAPLEDIPDTAIDRTIAGISGMIADTPIFAAGGVVGGAVIRELVKASLRSIIAGEVGSSLAAPAANLAVQASDKLIRAAKFLVEGAGVGGGSLGLEGVVKEAAKQAVGESSGGVGQIAAEGAKGAALGTLTFGLASQVPPGVMRTLTEIGAFGAAGPVIHEGRLPTIGDLVESGLQIGVLKAAFAAAKIPARFDLGRPEIVEPGSPQAAAAARAARVGASETPAAAGAPPVVETPTVQAPPRPAPGRRRAPAPQATPPVSPVTDTAPVSQVTEAPRIAEEAPAAVVAPATPAPQEAPAAPVAEAGIAPPEPSATTRGGDRVMTPEGPGTVVSLLREREAGNTTAVGVELGDGRSVEVKVAPPAPAQATPVDVAALDALDEPGRVPGTQSRVTVTQEPIVEATPPPVKSTTGLGELGDAGKAIADNLYETLWQKIERGDLTEAGGPSVVLQVGRRLYDAGAVKSAADLREPFAEVQAVRAGGLTGVEYQRAMEAIVAEYTEKAAASAQATEPPVGSPKDGEPTEIHTGAVDKPPVTWTKAAIIPTRAGVVAQPIDEQPVAGNATEPPAPFTLPRDLAGAKPGYNFGRDSYQLDFASDLDKALYILAQPNPSRRDADYLRAVLDYVNRGGLGLDERKVREMGAWVREQVKARVQGSPTGVVRINSLDEAARAAEAHFPPATEKSTIAGEGGTRRAGPLQRRPTASGAADRAPLGDVSPEDVARPEGGGDVRGSGPGGGTPDERRDVPAAHGVEGEPGPGAGVDAGGVGVPAERGGRPGPGRRPPRVAGDRRAAARGGGDDPEPGGGADSTEPDRTQDADTQRVERDVSRAGDEPRHPARDYRITDVDALGAGGPKEKARGNLEAIRLVKALEQAGRAATPAEQQALVKYVGWGGLPQIFDPQNHKDWTKEADALFDLLTSEEYAAARASTTNAHYTSAPVIQAMWSALERLGLGAGGRVLEPSMGVGHFFGLMPDALRPDTARTGVELDPITGRIATLLYPEANVHVAGFEAVKIPDNFFDLAISNVPFGNYGVHDPRYRKAQAALTRSIHDYFFAKALDVVRPGGLVAFITSHHTMDKIDSTVRTYLAGHADLIGAIRLPNTAFKGTAGTEVTTDIIFLQKRAPKGKAGGEAWTATQEIDGPDGARIRVNEYFARHPEMMLGTMALEGTQYAAKSPALIGNLTPEALAAAVARLPADVVTGRALEHGGSVAAIEIPEAGDTKEGGFAIKDGKVLVREGASFKPANVPATDVPRIKGMLEVRDAVRRVFRSQLEASDEAAITSAREALNTAYDGFVKRHGPLWGRNNYRAFEGDPDQPLLLSLEDWDAETKKATKTRVFTERTIARYTPVASTETASEALTVSLNELGRIDWPRMESLTGRLPKDLQRELGDLVYRDPAGGGWETADAYLSGNVREKLAAAEDAARADKAFQRNVEALKKVQPKDLEPGEIDVRLGAPWVPKEDVRGFVAELLDVGEHQVRIGRAEAIATWSVSLRGGLRGVANTTTWGTERYAAHDLIADALNLRTPTVYDRVGDQSVMNPEATMAAREQQERILAKFSEWVWGEPARAERLARKYNDEMNNLRLREFDGSHLALPGKNPAITLRPHQLAAVHRIMQSPTTLLAHVVGSGKTFEIAAAVMELKRVGLAKKPMVVVPNHLVDQWGAEFLRLYPAGNVLVAGKESFAKGKRQRMMARIATGNYDAVIVAHKSFEALPVSDAAFAEFMQEQIDELVAAIRQTTAEEGKSATTVKELEKAKRRLETKLQQRAKREAKDTALTFEELGVDAIFVDEAHAFKRLPIVTKMTRVAGVATGDSNRATDMFIKTRILRKMGGKVVFATGTPISNTMTEMFTMQRYLQMPELVARGLAAFDNWAASFGRAVAALEVAPTGAGYRMHTRFSKFTNLPELVSMFRLVADVQTADMLNLPRPALAGGKPKVIAAKASEPLKAYVQALLKRAEAVRAKHVDPSQDNMLKITGDGRKAALDMRLVDRSAMDLPTSKLNQAVGSIYDIWRASKDKRLTQVVFLDLSTPTPKGGPRKPGADVKGDQMLTQMLADPNIPEAVKEELKAGRATAKAPAHRITFSAYDDIKAKLLKRGVPASEIAFIHDADSDAAKLQLFRAVNAGRVRILMGSTEKMGVGTNVQQRLIALHHLDAPWRPSDIEQREGRILRQGNENTEVEIHRYVTEGSFDAYMWQTLETKQRFITQVMRGDVSVRSAEDVDGTALTFAEMKAIASGNPAVMEKVKVDAEVRKLDSLRAHHRSAQVRMTSDLAKQPAAIEQAKSYAARAKADLDRRDAEKAKSEEFAMVISGEAFSGKGAREKAGKALHRVLLTHAGNDIPTSVGSYLGLAIEVRGYTSKDITPSIYLVGESRYGVSVNLQSAAGTIQSIESVVTHLDGAEARARGEIAEAEKKLRQLKEEAGKPFEHEAKLRELTARQEQLNKALDLDKSDAQAAAADPDTSADEATPEEPDDSGEVDEGAPSNRADEVSQENLKEVRARHREEGQAGRIGGGLFSRRRGRSALGEVAPLEATPAGGGAGGGIPPGHRFRGHAEDPDGQVERALTSTSQGLALRSLGQRIVESYHAARRGTTYEYDLGRAGYGLEVDEIRVFQAIKRKVAQLAGEDVVGIVGRLPDLSELEHFTRIVYLRDYQARLLQPDRFPGGAPAGLTLDRVREELARLEETAPELVQEAHAAHLRLAEAEADDLIDRGLMRPEDAIPDYVHHEVLDFEGRRPTLPGQRRRGPPRRDFLKRAEGSERLIETDYIKAMFEHRMKVRWANAVDDFALEILRRHDHAESLDGDVRRALRPGQRMTILGTEMQAIQYKPGRAIFQAQTVPEQAIAAALAAGETTLQIDLEDVARRAALGRWYRIYVVPTPIAERFEHWAPREVEGMLRILNAATNRWKAVTIGFWGQAGNLLNLMGDLINLSRTPGALKELPAAVRDVIAWQRGTGGDLVRTMERYDVLDSGYVANEASFRSKAPEMRQFLTRGEIAKAQALAAVRFYFRTMPEFREAVPRVAMARYQLHRLERGRALRPGPIDIRGLEHDGERAAMAIARQFTVDYGRFTDFENKVLRGFLLPFYSWARQNTPNWLRFLWMSKIGLLAYLGTRLLLELWNNQDDEFQKVEQALPPYKRNSAHVITGWRDAQGKLIVVFVSGDPMMDALGWIGQAGTLNRLSDLATERITLRQATRQQIVALVKEPGSKAVGLLTPFLKVPIELPTNTNALTGGKIVPDALKGTSEALGRQAAHAAESAFRPMRETRMLREQAGKKDGIDPLSHRFGLGLPFERIDATESGQKVAMAKWGEARDEFVESVLDRLKDSPTYAALAPHQREIMLLERAREAAAMFNKTVRAPVTRKERLGRRFNQ